MAEARDETAGGSGAGVSGRGLLLLPPPGQQQQQQQQQQDQQQQQPAEPSSPAERARRLGERAAKELQHASPRALAAQRLQLACVDVRAREASALDAARAGRAARLEAVAARAAAVCPGAAAGAPPKGGEEDFKEYAEAFQVILDYASEWAAPAPLAAAAGAPARAAAAAALESVLPLSGVARWATLAPEARALELEPLAKITLGICLFNGGGGGSGSSSSGGAGWDGGGDGGCGAADSTTASAAGPATAAHTASWRGSSGGVGGSGGVSLGRSGGGNGGAGGELAAIYSLLRRTGGSSGSSSKGWVAAGSSSGGVAPGGGCAASGATATAASAPPSHATAQAQARRLAAALRTAKAAALAALRSAQEPLPRCARRREDLAEAMFCAQAAASLRALASDAARGASTCAALERALSDELARLRRAVGARAAVPRAAVLPGFERAGALRRALASELHAAVACEQRFEALAAALRRGAREAGLPDLLALTAAPGGSGDGSCVGEKVASDGASELALARVSAAFELDDGAAGCEYVTPAQLAALAAGEGTGGGAGDGSLAAAAAAADSSGSTKGAAAALVSSLLAFGGWCAGSLGQSDGDGAAAEASVAAGSSSSGGDGDGSVAAAARLLGALRPADPSLGALRFGRLLLGVSSPEAAARLAAGPARAVMLAARAAAEEPLLHHLLALHAATAAAASIAGTAATAATAAPPPLDWLARAARAPVGVEAATQTAAHAVGRQRDRGYEPNEWALRRRVRMRGVVSFFAWSQGHRGPGVPRRRRAAHCGLPRFNLQTAANSKHPRARTKQIIALANLRTKATRSSQTAESAFRADGGSQTWPPKQRRTQTAADKGQAMPRRLQALTGLRGAPGTEMGVVAVELDLGQPHQF